MREEAGSGISGSMKGVKASAKGGKWEGFNGFFG